MALLWVFLLHLLLLMFWHCCCGDKMLTLLLRPLSFMSSTGGVGGACGWCLLLVSRVPIRKQLLVHFRFSRNAAPLPLTGPPPRAFPPFPRPSLVRALDMPALLLVSPRLLLLRRTQTVGGETS